MKVTKTMKEYAEKKLNEEMQELIIKRRANYEAEKKIAEKACDAAIKSLLDELNDILYRHHMDNDEGNDWNSIIRYRPDNIQNSIEEQNIAEYVRKLNKEKKEILTDFYLTCDLGVNKEEFLEAVKKMRFKED